MRKNVAQRRANDQVVFDSQFDADGKVDFKSRKGMNFTEDPFNEVIYRKDHVDKVNFNLPTINITDDDDEDLDVYSCQEW